LTKFIDFKFARNSSRKEKMLNLKSILRRHTGDNVNDNGEDQMPKPQQQPTNITQNDRKGAIKNYSFVKTVNSLEELDKYRFQQVINGKGKIFSN
jgi:hypothetical protein